MPEPVNCWLLLVSAPSVGLRAPRTRRGSTHPTTSRNSARFPGGGCLPVRGHALGGERASYRWHLPCAGDGVVLGPWLLAKPAASSGYSGPVRWFCGALMAARS
jgi:hypothetical protein